MTGDALAIDVGWRPGLIGWTVAAHATYYARDWGFPAVFESKVAREMAGFHDRYRPERDVAFSVSGDVGFLATMTIDGSDPALEPGLAHLRWFIVSDEARGMGLGWRLMREALGFLRQSGAKRCFLTTFEGLGSARTLYDRAGFRLASADTSMTWGRAVTEQRFELDL